MKQVAAKGKQKMTKDVVPEGFTLSMVLVDAIPVLFFGASIILTSLLIRNPLFLVGAILCTLSGVLKVLWKLIVVLGKKNIWPLFLQMRIMMPFGFCLMALAAILSRGEGFSSFFGVLFSQPSILVFIIGCVGMLLMIVCAVRLDSSDTKANWIEQIVNSVAQVCIFIAILLVFFGGLLPKEWNGEKVLHGKQEKNGILWFVTEQGTLVVTGTYKSDTLLADVEDGPFAGKYWLAPENEEWMEMATSVYVDLENCDAMTNMFQGCVNVRTVDLSHFDGSKVSNMGAMFDSCSSLESVDFGEIHLPALSSAISMFYGCESLTEIALDFPDSSHLLSTAGMFEACTNLRRVDLSGMNLSGTTDFRNMFDGCTALEEVIFTGIDTENANTLQEMFLNCSALVTLDLSDFDTANAENMTGMFMGCSSLEQIDVSTWDVSKVVYMDAMFEGCESLTGIDVSGFDTTRTELMSRMFYGCTSLTEFVGPDYSFAGVGSIYGVEGMFGGAQIPEGIRPALSTLPKELQEEDIEAIMIAE